jgi:bacterioferritin (cytochrome b1)
MDITQTELELLNFYRASELHGGLILGQLVQHVRDPHLILRLTRHSAEEIIHAQLWTETIFAVGGQPWPTRDTYQARYATVIGPPSTMLEVLALTQVFERGVYRHFMLHARRPGTHPAVCATLRRMLHDERDHLSWVKHWLDDQAKTRQELVSRLMRRYAAVDVTVRNKVLREYHWQAAA